MSLCMVTGKYSSGFSVCVWSHYLLCVCLFFFEKTIIIIVFTERSPTVRPRPATGIQVVASTSLGTYYNIIMYTTIYIRYVYELGLRARYL